MREMELWRDKVSYNQAIKLTMSPHEPLDPIAGPGPYPNFGELDNLLNNLAHSESCR